MGYCPAKAGGAGRWTAKAYIPGASGPPRQQRLGAFPGVPANEQFAKAKAAAEVFFLQVASDGQVTTGPLITVEDAVRQYEATHPGAKQFCRRLYEDPIAIIKLRKLTTQDLAKWRTSLETRKNCRTGDLLTPSSVNREMTPLRAALYAAKLPDTLLAPLAPNVIAIGDGSRDLYLDRAERRALLAHCSAEIRPFVLALCSLPVRPGALARLTVANFIKKTGTLSIPAGIDKSPSEKRPRPRRDLQLPPAALALFTELARDKTPATLLLRRADLAPWTADNWKKPIRRAALAAGLDPTTCAYTLRHSVITDLVNEGVPTMNIAKLAGTSVKMIEETYAKLLDKQAYEALATLKPLAPWSSAACQ